MSVNRGSDNELFDAHIKAMGYRKVDKVTGYWYFYKENGKIYFPFPTNDGFFKGGHDIDSKTDSYLLNKRYYLSEKLRKCSTNFYWKDNQYRFKAVETLEKLADVIRLTTDSKCYVVHKVKLEYCDTDRRGIIYGNIMIIGEQVFDKIVSLEEHLQYKQLNIDSEGVVKRAIISQYYTNEPKEKALLKTSVFVNKKFEKNESYLIEGFPLEDYIFIYDNDGDENIREDGEEYIKINYKIDGRNMAIVEIL